MGRSWMDESPFSVGGPIVDLWVMGGPVYVCGALVDGLECMDNVHSSWKSFFFFCSHFPKIVLLVRKYKYMAEWVLHGSCESDTFHHSCSLQTHTQVRYQWSTINLNLHQRQIQHPKMLTKKLPHPSPGPQIPHALYHTLPLQPRL